MKYLSQILVVLLSFAVTACSEDVSTSSTDPMAGHPLVGIWETRAEDGSLIVRTEFRAGGSSLTELFLSEDGSRTAYIESTWTADDSVLVNTAVKCMALDNESGKFVPATLCEGGSGPFSINGDELTMEEPDSTTSTSVRVK